MRIEKGTLHSIFLSVLVTTMSSPLLAMQPLGEAELSSVHGRDGLVLNLETSNSGISADSIDVTLDPGQPYEGTLSLGGVSLIGRSDLMNPLAVGDAPVRLNNSFDLGSINGDPRLRWELSLDGPARLAVNRMTLGDSNRSFGSFVLDAGDAGLELINKGLFSMDTTDAYLKGYITDAALFYRQLWHAHPYMTMDNLDLFWEMPSGTLGIASAPVGDASSYGIYMSSGDSTGSGGDDLADSLINIGLKFDLNYRFPVAGQPGCVSGNCAPYVMNDEYAAPMLQFAWLGALKDARLIWGPGGAWGPTGSWDDQQSRPGGLRLESRWNYVSAADAAALNDSEKEFRWRFAEAAGEQVGIELADWRNMPGVDYAHDWKLIGLDVIPGGVGGPGGVDGGLCWGGASNNSSTACTGQGNLLRLSAGDVNGLGFDSAVDYDALAIMVREGNILAYSNKVNILGATETIDVGWGLIYTLANVDGNIYLYPGGNPSHIENGSLNSGIYGDILLVAQSLNEDGNQMLPLNRAQDWDGNTDYWDHDNLWNRGMHFMIADTEACTGALDCAPGEEGMGIGLIGSSLLVGANDTRIWVKPAWDADVYNGGIDLLSPQARIAVNGIFGGGTIPNGAQLVSGALVDINLEGLLNVRLSPSPSDCATAGGCFLGYSMAARLYDIGDGGLYPQGNNQLASGRGSYIALAELSRPDMAYTLGGITGDFAITNGKADMIDRAEESDDQYKLRLSNDILFGATANNRLLNGVEGGGALPGGTTAQPFMVNNISLGPDRMGAVAIPSGQWHASVTLRPQNTSPSFP